MERFRLRCRVSRSLCITSDQRTRFCKLFTGMMVTECMIKIFRGGAGVVTPSKPPPPTNNFCLYPPPVLRCFWKDPLMTPTPPLHFKHLSLLPPPHPPPLPHPLKILVIHRYGLRGQPTWPEFR